jgi:hypothetical protein
MKLVLALLFLGASASAYSIVDADGCYQTFVPGSMYPAVCVSGSNEEGRIPTANIAIFGTNTDSVVWCGRATSIVRHSFAKNSNSVEFGFHRSTGMNSIKINGVKSRTSEEGKFVFNEVAESVDLQYFRLDDKTAKRLLNEMRNSEECSSL